MAPSYAYSKSNVYLINISDVYTERHFVSFVNAERHFMNMRHIVGTAVFLVDTKAI